MRRRSLLASLAGGGLAAVAGCTALAGDDRDEASPDGGDVSPDDYDLLADQRVYVAPAVSLTLPDDVATVDGPEDATLLLLPDTTDVAPAAGVGWLAAGKAVALAGPEGQATLVEWLESDAYAETFDSDGIAVGSPPPDFLVAFGIDREYVSKHSYTWEGTADPDDERYLGALEDALRDVGTLEEDLGSAASPADGR